MALPDNLFDGYLNTPVNLARSWQNKFSVPKLSSNYTPREATIDLTPESTSVSSGTPDYVRKTFDKDELLRKMYGTLASRRDRRRFEKYWNSDQRIADLRNFDAAEWDAWDKAERARHNEFMDSIKDSSTIYKDWLKNQQSLIVNQPAAEITSPAQPPTPPAQTPASVAPTTVKQNETTAPTKPTATNPTSQKSIIRDIAGYVPILGSFVTNSDLFNNPTKAKVTDLGKHLALNTLSIPFAPLRVAKGAAKGLWNGVKEWWNSLPEYQHGGSVHHFLQGGEAPKQDIKVQVAALVQAVAAGNKQAAEQLKQIMEAAKKGDEKALQIAQLIEQEIQNIQKAKQGAKINYIRHLKGKCPEGEELVYFKKGGLMTCGCLKKQNGDKLEKFNAVEEFKRRRRKA